MDEKVQDVHGSRGEGEDGITEQKSPHTATPDSPDSETAAAPTAEKSDENFTEQHDSEEALFETGTPQLNGRSGTPALFVTPKKNGPAEAERDSVSRDGSEASID